MNAEEITTEFFKRRFPKSDLEFEKKCGYFNTWVRRFETPDPEICMDNASLYIWREMKKEFNLK